MENENRNTALVPVSSKAVVPLEAEPAGYWARIGRLYRTATLVLVFVLALFIITFSVLFAHAFSYDSIFYFGKDIATLSTLPEGGDATVYYDDKGESALPASYRGGVAVVHRNGVDIYAANSERQLSVDFATPFNNPRIAVSRNYLVAYDFGAQTFVVCNSYDVLFEGKTEGPIYGVTLSDSGYFTVIVGSKTALSEVLLYDADFNLRQRFGRASATVSAMVSDNGRTVTLVGATAEGTVVDTYIVGDEKPLSQATLEGFPLAAGYTANTKLTVLTDVACYAMSTEGKVYETVRYDGAALAAYTVSEEGTAIALEVNRIHAEYRVLVLDKKGNVEADLEIQGPVKSLSLSNDRVFLLRGADAVAIDPNRPDEIETLAVPEDSLGIAFVTDKGARVICPAMALYFKASR